MYCAPARRPACCLDSRQWSIPRVRSQALAKTTRPRPLAQQTDQQIGSLLQRWPELDAIQRRDLLAEVRKRMHLAKKVEANVNNTSLQNRAPSLTLRIKKAQTQHRYGRVSNRPSGNLNDQNVSTPQNQSTKRDAPREMVIRTSVTQILPDGSRLSTRTNIGAWHAAVSIKRKAARIRALAQKPGSKWGATCGR